MGLFNLFDKKVCDICGNEIGLFGSRKVEDGVVCSKCTAKLSPYFTERKRSTVEDIRQQLAYREENRDRLAAFKPDYIVDGSSKQVRVDQEMGCFIVYDGENWEEGNPDLISLDDVVDCTVHIDEHETEVMRRNMEGKMEPVFPRQFEYDYSFNVTIVVNHPYISTIRYEMTNYAHRPESPYEDLFQYNVEEAKALYAIMTGKDFTVNYNAFRYRETVVSSAAYHQQPQVVVVKKVVREVVAPRKPDHAAPQPHSYSYGNNTQPYNNGYYSQPNYGNHTQPQNNGYHAQPQNNGYHNQPNNTQQSQPQPNNKPQQNTQPAKPSNVNGHKAGEVRKELNKVNNNFNKK